MCKNFFGQLLILKIMDTNTEKPKPFIKTLSICAAIPSSVTIDCGDGTTVTIEIPLEIIKDLTLDQKFAILKLRGERYIKCIASDC